jgi:hypothetical protein
MTKCRTYLPDDPCRCGHPFSAHLAPTGGGRGYCGKRYCTLCACRRFMPRVIPTLAVCVLDGLPLHSHLACAICGILIGPAHKEKSVNERGVCPSCAVVLDKSRPVARWDAVFEVRSE